MPEKQNIEYKQTWHDDYLKWVCGFANAHEGGIFIGKDDNGTFVGVEVYKKLMLHPEGIRGIFSQKENDEILNLTEQVLAA